jgi:3-oxoacyl-[acyl-carrier-protein] synthase-1
MTEVGMRLNFSQASRVVCRSLLMMRNDFAAASAHLEKLDPAAEGLPILRQRLDAPLTTLMSNSFGFGGTNASLVFSRFVD